MTTPETAAAATASATLTPFAPRAAFVHRPNFRELPENVLFGVTFGDAHAPAVAGSVRVPLERVAGSELTELWYANGPVVRGTTGAIRHSTDDHFLAGVIEVDEREHGGIVGAAELAYRAIVEFHANSRYPHLLRTWNHLDAINLGDGDAERYRGFCTGRVSGLTGNAFSQHPAATVIGRRDGRRVLQVYWLAGRRPGVALENPRQLPAYRYPREYGPASPTFSRAMLVAADLLLISGTASIVGHASQHPGSVAAQAEEILTNIDSLLSLAHSRAPALPARFARHTLLKAYVRNRSDAAQVESILRAHLPEGVPLLVLLGDVCRADLLVEFDGLHAAG